MLKPSFLNKFNDKKIPGNMPRERFYNLINDLFNNFENEITFILIENDNQELNDLIRDTFIENNINLQNLINKYYCITFVSSGSKVSDFEQIGAHKKESILLDEAYHLQLSLGSPMNFMTFDSDVLGLKDEIHNNISKNVTVSSPIEFKPAHN